MKYRFNGKIKAITFKDARVSVLLEDTTFLSNDGDWKQWTDWELIKSGKYKKGEVWVSAFEQSAPEVYQACKMIEKGSEVEVDIFKTEKGFLNINNIRLGVPERDINEDLKPPDMPDEKQPQSMSIPTEQPEFAPADKTPPKPSTTVDTPSSTQRDKKGLQAQIEEMVEESSRVDGTPAPSTTVSKEVLIIRQTCIKAVGAMITTPYIDRDDIVALARRLETYVLTGE